MHRACKIGLVFLMLLSIGCMKDDTGIPNVLINIPPISLLDPNYAKLMAPNNFIFLEGGIAGIVVYNTGNGYVAYDRCSTVNPAELCSVEIDETGLSLIDPCSGGKFDLATGLPGKAPAKKALKKYRVLVTGDGYLLRVTN